MIRLCILLSFLFTCALAQQCDEGSEVFVADLTQVLYLLPLVGVLAYIPVY